MKEEISNGFVDRIVQVIQEMKSEQGENFCLEKINLAELERRTGVSSAKLKRLKKHGFVDVPHGLEGRKADKTVTTGYTAIVDDLLRSGVTNSAVYLSRLQKLGFPGGLTTVKEYIEPIRISFPPNGSWWLHRGIVDAGTPPSRERPFRWTGASPKSWITTVASTVWPALPWFATTVDSVVSSFSPMQSRRLSNFSAGSRSFLCSKIWFSSLSIFLLWWITRKCSTLSKKNSLK